MSAVSDDLAKDTGKSAGKIGISLLIAIGLGYVLTLVVSRVLEPEVNKVFLSFWGVLMGLGSALSPLEQEISRQSAVAALDGGRAGKPALRAITVGGLVVAVVSALSLIPAATDRLFGGDPVLALLVLLGGVSFACQFGTRGLFIGQNRVRQFSWLILAEAAIRIVVLGALVVASIAHLVPLAIAATAGSFAWLFFARPAAKLVDPHLDGESWRPITGRILLLMLGAGLTASVITGYPAMVNLLAPGGDGAQLATLFLALTVARIPLMLMSPVQAIAVPTVVRLSSTDEGLHKLRRYLVLGAFGTIAVGAIGALVGLLIGPWLIQLLYGAKYAAEGWWVAGLVWSSVLIAAIQLMTAVLVAQTRANKVLITWAVVAVSTALTLVLMPGDTILRAVVGLIVGPTLGLAVVTAFVVRKPAPVG
ncbi:Membrane protein involved in the export of O-antigen and teichoic acid [Amycolatopsis xylanica]|uniref:Membrane protein involved in the export of O-antigen and teichoic acid n=1 Tax=Amycolatopsis xylanica TaxID=589385 RepID=A0A1H2ZEX1_9PSEU|nr:hypothetical protein [Amycolatopsis xylanica]SDX15895.1 Membrane protein involved in the export of O-antigen and teichoic acid [Amycolatopsis xylanica]